MKNLSSTVFIVRSLLARICDCVSQGANDPIFNVGTRAGGVLDFTNIPDPATNNFWRIRSVP
jgi:hypothetical protein